jgi:hypothetical protein
VVPLEESFRTAEPPGLEPRIASSFRPAEIRQVTPPNFDELVKTEEPGGFGQILRSPVVRVGGGLVAAGILGGAIVRALRSEKHESDAEPTFDSNDKK